MHIYAVIAFPFIFSNMRCFRFRHHPSFYGVLFVLDTVMSCSDYFVLSVASFLLIIAMDYVMMLVPLATLVHMDIKTFPSRPSVPLFITYGIVYHFLSLWTPCLVVFTSVCSRCGITNIPVDYVISPSQYAFVYHKFKKKEFDIDDSNEIR
ncbi:hypothetical protein Tsp_05922 [Trichinella spiralis]|uniref:hypothetical protein n=1 Tax=Trichinella spiralis TaxID=6334 RepID=UPI0001EFC9B6|nr:hypothetical protein Tsp_05922 [Trichinella spiralis]